MMNATVAAAAVSNPKARPNQESLLGGCHRAVSDVRILFGSVIMITQMSRLAAHGRVKSLPIVFIER